MSVQTISKARVDLLLEEPFYGSLLMRLLPVEKKIGTTATDGTHLYYDPEFIAQRSPAEMKALLAHEVMHCAMGHLWRRDGREPFEWNIACDIAINQILRQSGFVLPQTGLEPEENKYPNMSAEDIYARRQRNKPKNPQVTLIACRGMIEPSKGKGGKGEGDPQEGEGQEGGSSDWGDVKSEADWRVALEIAVKTQQHGNVPAGIRRLMEELHETKVDWRTVLRRFIARTVPQDYSWVEPNRRFIGQGIYLPGIVREGTPRLGLAVDTSGSIGGDLLSEFAAEVTSIIEECKPEVLEIVFCDAEVANVVEYLPGDIVDLEHDAKGGGGTAFEPALNYFTKHPAGPPVAVIYLTDGYAGRVEEEPPYPVIWCISPDGCNYQTFGEEIKLG